MHERINTCRILASMGDSGNMKWIPRAGHASR
jgi:hypothetical protein